VCDVASATAATSAAQQNKHADTPWQLQLPAAPPQPNRLCLSEGQSKDQADSLTDFKGLSVLLCRAMFDAEQQPHMQPVQYNSACAAGCGWRLLHPKCACTSANRHARRAQLHNSKWQPSSTHAAPHSLMCSTRWNSQNATIITMHGVLNVPNPNPYTPACCTLTPTHLQLQQQIGMWMCRPARQFASTPRTTRHPLMQPLPKPIMTP
jgi:hypothetical protein